jgi:hypothetical protein
MMPDTHDSIIEMRAGRRRDVARSRTAYLVNIVVEVDRRVHIAGHADKQRLLNSSSER